MTERELITHHQFSVMGGPASVAIRHTELQIDSVNRLLNTIEQDALGLEAKYSRYRDNSLISQINNKAGDDDFIPIDIETWSLLDFCRVLHEQSQGLFDPTSGVLGEVWDFKAGLARDRRKLADLLGKVGWQHVELSDGRVRLTLAGMALDLGGIVKEYAVDKAIASIREAGFSNAMVEFAGDVMAIGSRDRDRSWRVGIASPSNPEAALESIELTDAAMATSGSYQRYIELDGERYSHFLNPKTGMPVKSPRSVTVISKSCITAGAVATVACLHSVEQAKPWLESSGLPWLMVSESGALMGPLAHADDYCGAIIAR